MASALLAAIDAPTATVMAAIVAGAFGVAIRWTPKTRSEAGLDRANAQLTEAQALALTVQEQRTELTRVHARVDELENALSEERRECDRRIDVLDEQNRERNDELEGQIAELRARLNEV